MLTTSVARMCPDMLCEVVMGQETSRVPHLHKASLADALARWRALARQGHGKAAADGDGEDHGLETLYGLLVSWIGTDLD